MLKRKYKGFTLVEVVVVMGVIIILMGVGLVGARAYLDNASATRIRATVSEIYKAAASWKQTHSTYPVARDTTRTTTDSGAQLSTFKELMTNNKLLNSYFSTGLNLGSKPYTFLYMTDNSGSFMLVCASLGGDLGSTDVTGVLAKGIYCDGDGFKNTNVINPSISNKEVAYGTSEFNVLQTRPISGRLLRGNWDSVNKSF